MTRFHNGCNLNHFTQQWSISICLIVLAFQPIDATAQLAPQGANQQESVGDIQKQHEEAQKLWDQLHDELLALGDRYAQQEKLPEPSMFKPFGNNKEKNKKKIDQLVSKLVAHIGHSSMDDLFKEREKIAKKIKEKKKSIVQIEEKIFGAKEHAGLFSKDKNDLQQDLMKVQKEIEALDQSLEMTYLKLQQSFETIGVKISLQQVKDLFTVVSGSTMKTYFIRFSNLRLLSDMIAYFLDKTQKNPSYSRQAKRYYGVYVALVALLIEAHEEAAQRIELVHKAKINEILRATATQIQTTKRLMKQPGQEMNQEAYQQNLEIQEKLLNASKSYNKYLTTQHGEIMKALKDLEAKFVLVLNTYQTASLANQLITTIKAGIRDIQDLQSLKLPEMIPLSDQKLRNEFQVVDEQMGFGQVDDLRRSE